MSKFIKNKKAVMSLTFLHVGLIIATGILLSAVISVVFLNDWQKKADLENIASGFSTLVQGMDTRFFENVTMFYLPDKNYDYNISISTEYVTVDTSGNWFNTLSIKHRFLKKPLLNRNYKEWITGKNFHSFLNDTYGCFGNETDPVMSTDVDLVKDEIKSIFEQANFSFSADPFYLEIEKPVYIEQVFIFYDLDGDNEWDKENDEKQSFVLVYQI